MGLNEPALSLSDLLAGHGREPGKGDEAEERDGVPADIARSMIEVGQLMDRRGWVPATAGNISNRLDGDRVAITRSGCHKGFLRADDVMVVDLQGLALSAARPSAETLLHCQVYRRMA